MKHPLQNKIRSLGRVARGLSFLCGLSLVICLIVVSGTALAAADYALYVFLRWDDIGVRVMFAAVFLIAVSSAFFVFLWPVFRRRWSDIEIAQRVECYIPSLRDRLSSSIDFLNQSTEDRAAGSPTLRKIVINDTLASLHGANLYQVIRFRPVASVAITAMVFCVTALSLMIGWAPARLAAQRLVLPLSHAPWPKRNNLEFENAPNRLAIGDDLELRLLDRNGHLPDGVEFQYRIAGENHSHKKTMKMLDDRMVVRLENVSQSIEYRAEGGDDISMPWRTIEVVEAPTIVGMHVKVHPPEYTGWPTGESGSHIRAIEGSRVEISGSLSKPVTQVKLFFEQDGTTESYDALVVENGLAFRVPGDGADPWLAQKAGEYWFELVDQEGLVGGRKQRWRMQLYADSPSIVSIEKPNGNAYVSPSAVVPLEAIVKDDIAIKSIELRYLLSTKTENGEQSIQLYSSSGEKNTNSSGAGQGDSGESRTVRYAWDLSKLGDLQSGQSFDYYIAASDFRPQAGLSSRRQLIVIAEDDLEDRIGHRQSHILSQLSEVLRLQRETRTQTKALEIQLEETGSLQKEDVDQLQSAELNQRQVGQLLSGENGIQSQIIAVLTDLEINRIDSPGVERRMKVLLAEVRRIHEEHLSVVQRELVNSLKLAREGLRETASSTRSTADSELMRVRDPLSEVGNQQEKVIKSLEELLDDYSGWDNFRRFSREIRQMRRDQEGISAQTSELPKEMLGKSADDLTRQESAKLKILAHRQLEIARRFDALRSRMGQMQSSLIQMEPLVAKTLGDAVDSALRRAIGGQMRQIGNDIGNNRRGQAIQMQQEVAESLEELIDILANRREQELQRLVEKLDEAASELEGLRDRQAAIRAELKKAADSVNQQEKEQQLQRLTHEQQQLAAEVDRLSRQLQRLRAERSAESAAQAGSSMQQSGNAAGQGDADSALDAAERAEKQLEDAQQQLNQARREAEQELYSEKFAKLKQKIVGLIARQENIVNETIRLDDLLSAQENFTKGQQASIQDLSREQRTLATDTGIQADKVSDAEAFALALRGAIREMLRAARQLGHVETGEVTQKAEQIAQTRLQQLVDALSADDDLPPPDENGSSGPQGNLPTGDTIQIIAQLELLKSMQLEINRRTAELEEASLRRGGTLTEEQESELMDLAKEQGNLADIAFNLSQPTSVNPEDDPEDLPDVRRKSSLDDDLEKALKGTLPGSEDN